MGKKAGLDEDESGPLLDSGMPTERKLKMGAAGCAGCSFSCCLLVVAIFFVRAITLGPLFKNGGELDYYRPKAALEAEELRRAAAMSENKLLTYRDLPNAKMVASNIGSATYFPYFNFVQGFLQPGFWNAFLWSFKNKDKFKPPVKDEKVGVMSYQEFAKTKWGKEFSAPYFKDFYTGGNIPSWEDNGGHSTGVGRLDMAVAAARKFGVDPVDQLREMEPRFAFDNKALTKAAWDGFRYMGPMDIRYASNGAYGIAVIEHLMEKYNTTGDVLGLLMTDSVFSAHLKRVGNQFTVDLTSMEGYEPIKGYARLGGRATFVEDGGRLRTVLLEYAGQIHADFDVPDVEANYVGSKRTGWRFAEAAIIASLLSMTNLVMHVKDLHLELAAAFQAVTVDAFAGEPKHPVRRLLDPFISRSVQATNDNFKLLFNYHAADFSLAPLDHKEQIRLIGDFVVGKPLNLAEMDMENYGKVQDRNMEEDVSTLAAVTNSSRWGWRWHYRALTVQRLYDELVRCWLEAHFKDKEGGVATAVENDGVLQAWWQSMIDHIPSLKRATQLSSGWANPGKLTLDSLSHVARVLMVWLSWIHEDVGHAAAAYVYNPVYTPMCVPEDGIGVPAASWSFNAAAYRGFVFLHRASLLEQPPDFWFDGNDACRQCFTTFQDTLRALGNDDVAFSECEKTGFYSCVDRVETAVSS